MRVGIIGLGLIGSSFAKALKANISDYQFAGYDNNSSNIKYALNHNIIDKSCDNIESIFRNSDFILIAIPLNAYSSVFDKISKLPEELIAGKIISDAGSVKSNPLDDILQKMPKSVQKSFIYCHPIAGREISGIEASKSDLYKGKKTVICPNSNNDKSDIELVKNLWLKAGNSEILEMSAKDHDYLYAKLSHFVQFGAYCFRDFFKNYKCPVIGSFERLYKSPSNIWQPIFKYNEKNIDKVRKDFLYQLRVNIGNIGDQYPPDPDEQKYGIIDIEQSDNGPLYAAHTVAKSLYEITSEEERAYAGTGFKSFTQPLTENILPPPSDMIKPSLKEILFEIANYVENRNISGNF